MDHTNSTESRISNSEIKMLRSLSVKKIRMQEGLFILEGYRLIKEALLSGYPLQKIWMTDVFQQSATGKFIKMLSNKNSVPAELIPPRTLSQISDTRNNQGIIATAPLQRSAGVLSDQVVVLYKISDPGNMGTMLRTAEWFGIKTVVISRFSADPFNPKAVRSAMGAHFYMNIIDNPDQNIFKMLKDSGHKLIAAVLNGEPAEKLVRKRLKKWALVLGSEAHGIEDHLMPMFDHTASIPRIGNIDSLNVAIAGGIILQMLTKKRVKS